MVLISGRGSSRPLSRWRESSPVVGCPCSRLCCAVLYEVPAARGPPLLLAQAPALHPSAGRARLPARTMGMRTAGRADCAARHQCGLASVLQWSPGNSGSMRLAIFWSPARPWGPPMRGAEWGFVRRAPAVSGSCGRPPLASFGWGGFSIAIDACIAPGAASGLAPGATSESTV